MKFQTVHPDPKKQGTKIDHHKYEQVKQAICLVLSRYESLSFQNLTIYTKEELHEFQGSKGWYITTVKLDLEARNVIKVDRNTSPQMISLSS